jgi:N-methylhydantoinase B
VTSAGGGWGDPLARDPDKVRVDVRDGYVTPSFARERYGVVVTGDPEEDPEGVAVDEAATAALRAELAQADRGEPPQVRTEGEVE